MTHLYTLLIRIILNKITLLILLIAVAVAPAVEALPLSTYAGNSRLADGNWVKVKVDESGMYMITNAALEKMGFSDPSKVRVYGYGAALIPDKLDGGYIDDLPMVQSLTTSRGIVFYAVGPRSFTAVSASDPHLRPVNNYFTTVGYYFLSDSGEESRGLPVTGYPSADSPQTAFNQPVVHEKELVTPGQTGHILVGEDFLYTPSRSFSFKLADRVAGSKVWMECSFVANSASNTNLSFTANTTPLPSSAIDYVTSSTDSHGHYKEAKLRKEFDLSGDRLSLGIKVSNSGTMKRANLNYLSINYTRHLRIDKSPLPFILMSPQAQLSGASPSTQIWDVTDPMNISRIDAGRDGDKLTWTSSYLNRRDYVAFDENMAFPAPEVVGKVANQNIHAAEVPDMVIFTPSLWRDQAQRLADLHYNSSDSLKVLVLSQDDVFNEFSSGSRDVNAFRKCLKMFYDRSAQSDTKLRYALMFGRGINDNRTLAGTPPSYPLMPIWETEGGVSDTDSFTTDDIFGFLLDGSGIVMGTDRLCISVGRLPVTSSAMAKIAVDKIEEYIYSMPDSGWRNHVLVIADDDDGGVHMEQAEKMCSGMVASDGGSAMAYDKLYTDRYDRVGGQYPLAREAMFKALDEGVAWWFFIGHANTTSWTHEGLLTYSDINNLYLKHYPIIVATTCDFLRWDARTESAAEIMWALKGGGAIAIVSANRPVYIADNGRLSTAFGREAFRYKDDGTRPTIGEIYRNAKNSIPGSDTNKLRYVLMGDPALRPIVPENKVVVTSINGVDPSDPDNQVVMKARQIVTVEGYVADHSGKIIDDFNGTVNTTLYDAEYSVTTKGNGDNGKEFLYDRQGDRIFAGNDSIRAGRFSIDIAMPSAISGNFRPAALSLVANPRKGVVSRERGYAAGVNRDFYVFGEDDTVIDTVPPVIESIYINHPAFRNGDRVNGTPMLVARISDNRGINMSVAGIGHQMAVIVDGKKTYTNVSEYYTPSASEPGAGTVAFPLGTLQNGEHQVKLRVWDTSDNSASATVDFVVADDLAPTIYDVYSDANPASTVANFYLSHDRPDQAIEVTLTVYNLAGKPVWSSTTSGRSDMYLSYPISWDLRDKAGHRVPRGIYIYRASVTADGVESATKSRKLAVTG